MKVLFKDLKKGQEFWIDCSENSILYKKHGKESGKIIAIAFPDRWSKTMIGRIDQFSGYKLVRSQQN